MKVRTLKLFNDLQSNKLRKPGEIFDVTKERYEKINSTSHGALVEVIEDESKEEKSQDKKSKKVVK